MFAFALPKQLVTEVSIYFRQISYLQHAVKPWINYRVFAGPPNAKLSRTF